MIKVTLKSQTFLMSPAKIEAGHILKKSFRQNVIIMNSLITILLYKKSIEI